MERWRRRRILPFAEKTESTETSEITEKPDITGYPEGRIKESSASRAQQRNKAGKAHRARQPIKKPVRVRVRGERARAKRGRATLESVVEALGVEQRQSRC